MKHLIIFGIILIGMIILKTSNECKIEKMTNISQDLYLKTSKLGGKYGRGFQIKILKLVMLLKWLLILKILLVIIKV